MTTTGEFKCEAEDQSELGGEGDVVSNAPFVGNAHFLAIVVEEIQNLGENEEIGEENPGKEQSESNGKCRPECLFLISF